MRHKLTRFALMALLAACLSAAPISINGQDEFELEGNCNLEHGCNLNGCYWNGEICYRRNTSVCSSGWCCAGSWDCGSGGVCWYAGCA